MLKFTENFSMTFAENRTYGVPEFARTEVNRHSGKLKGLSGYLQNHYPRVMKSPMGHFRRSQVASSHVQHHHKYSSSSSEYRHNSSKTIYFYAVNKRTLRVECSCNKHYCVTSKGITLLKGKYDLSGKCIWLHHLICTSLYYMMYWRTWAKKDK